MPFNTLTDEEEKELYRLQRFYWREARRCEESKAYLAGCVMLGSALEALLILMVNVYPDEAEKTGQAPMAKGNPKALLDWKLVDLLRVAKAATWLPAGLALTDEWNFRKARIGDHAEMVRIVRNLAHPARYLEDHRRRIVTAKYLRRQFEVVLLCRDRLLERNNSFLLEHMKDEGLL
jgi:hypothetical protein